MGPCNAALSVYPSPFTTGITISSSTIQTAVIIDAAGKTITSLQLNAGANYINTATLGKGMYLLKTTGGQVIKMIKQ